MGFWRIRRSFRAARHSHLHSGLSGKGQGDDRHARVKRNTVLYMDYGALEFADHPHSRSLFAEVSALLIEKRVLLNSRIVPRGTHCEASWEKQIPFFMKTLFE